jgi:sugar-specific transcriptional regulator TrmB
MKSAAKQLMEAFNLSEYEAKTYLAAQGSSLTITGIAQRAGIPRTAAYPPIRALLAKGLLFEQKGKHTRSRYSAVGPDVLKSLYQRKGADLDLFLSTLAPSIQDGSGKMAVRYFQEFLNSSPKSSIWKTFEDPKTIEQLSGATQFEAYIKQRLARGIHCRAILPAYSNSPWTEKAVREAKKNLLDVKLISETAFPFQASIAVCGSQILIIEARETVFALFINNARLARTL